MVKRAIIRVIIDDITEEQILEALTKIKEALSEYQAISVQLDRVR